MPPYRIVFMGTPAFAVPSLVKLGADPTRFQVVAAICQPDKPVGRGRTLGQSPVKEQALAMGLPIHQPTSLKKPDIQAELLAYQADFLVVAAYGRILPGPLLAGARLGAINVHASLLPRHRGASPIAHALLAGDGETGVCLMRMDEGLDTGPVYCRMAIPIEPHDTSGSLSARLAQVGADLLVDSLPAIGTGKLVAVPQDEAAATYAPLLHKHDGALDLGATAVDLERRIRAFAPWPGTFVQHHGNRVAVLRARATNQVNPAAPGTVLQANAQGVEVACGQGTLWLDEVKPAGRKAMTAPAWVAGRGVTRGEVLTNAATLNP